jgi:4-hydroxy-tetrahydrodipicolinate reductase
MTYRVIQWATGQLGKHTVIGIAGHPDLQLVGGWVHSPEKEGRDLGDVVGLGPLGVRATRDKDALLASDADCVCYTAARTWVQDPTPTIDELVRILRSGKNVVNAAFPPLVHPAGVSAEIHRELQDACLAGGSSLYTSGVDPGYGSLGLAMTALNVTSEVRSLHTYEIANYASYSDPTISKLMGFGQPDVKKCALLQPGWTAAQFGSSLHLLAKSMGVEIEEITEGYEVVYAEAPFDVAAGHIPAGTISGMRFSARGMIGGEPRIIVEHVTRLREEDFPEVDFHGYGYRAEVEGEPRIRLDMDLTSQKGDAVHAAHVACAMALVNAIPQVCDAPPGILTYLDLRSHPSKNFAAT